MRLQVAKIAKSAEPAHFFLGPRQITVIEIIDRWPDVDYQYFKVLADDGNTYILRHDENADLWEMTFFRSGDQA